MGKSILIFSAALITYCVTTFDFSNLSNTGSDHVKTTSCNAPTFHHDFVTAAMIPVVDDFFYDLAPRYKKTLTKTEMGLVRSAYEFENLDHKNPKEIVSYYSVSVSIMDDDYKPIQTLTGSSGEFNAEQLELFRSVPYSTDILIKSEYQMKNAETGAIQNGGSTPHITVVPEQQAEYVGGKDAFLAYLKTKSANQASKVTKDKLKPGKVRFTVTEKGAISNVSLIATSGYPAIDKKMVELINKAPEKWSPASDGKGNEVKQQLVFSFGIVGC